VIIIEIILLNLINSIIQGSGEIINSLLIGLTEKIFYCEQAFSQVLGSSSLMDFTRVYKLFFDFAISLIILKFVKKGFDIYIGWYEGDKDNEPANLAVNFIRAIITALSFNWLYGILVNIVTDFMDNSLLMLLTLDESQSLLDAVLIHISHSLFWGISALIIIICYCVLWVKFHVLGIEMFILRLGFPIACTGLIDSDKGMFAPYLKKLLIICATAVIQIFLLRLSIILIGSGHLIWGMAFCFAALKAPKSLNEFMFAYGNGNILGTAINTGYQVSQVKRMITAVKPK